jgi:signal peptidase I
MEGIPPAEQGGHATETSGTNPAGGKGLFGGLADLAKILGITLAVAFFLKFFIIEAYRIPSASMEETLYAGDFLLVNKFIYGAKSPRYIPLTDIALPYFTLPALSSPSRGDVVVFESPVWRKEPGDGVVNYVKRCIGLPGDTVKISRGVVTVNSRIQPFPPRGKQEKVIPYPPGYADLRLFPRGSSFTQDDYGPVVVPHAGEEVRLSPENIDLWREVIQGEGHTLSVEGGDIRIDGRPATTYVVEQQYYFMMGDNRRNSLDSRFWGFLPEDLIIGRALLIYWSWDESLRATSLPGRLSSIRWDRIGTFVQ